jgi:transcriptional regulator of arginine metabolism
MRVNGRAAPPAGVASKAERHSVIRELIRANEVASQEELRELLAKRGVRVTQATLSRDLRELGIGRMPSANGSRYAEPEAIGETLSLDSVLPQLFVRMDGVRELIILHTMPSGAQPVSEAIDAAEWPEVLGTVAGDNTILIICRSTGAQRDVMTRLGRLARSG